MTEEQRYQGKLYVPKSSQDKNQKKQDSWVDNIHQYIEQGHGGLEVRFLRQIAEHPNVPRKKPKFANFVKTVLKLHDPHKIDAIWTHVTKANENNKSNDSRSNGGDIDKTADPTSNGTEAASTCDGPQDVDQPSENCTMDEPAAKKRKKEQVNDDEKAQEQEGSGQRTQDGDENNDNNKGDVKQGKGVKKPKKEKKEKLPKYRWKSQITALLNEMGPMTLRKLQSRLYIRYKKQWDPNQLEDKETVYARIAQATEKSSKVTFTPENNMVTLNKSKDREES